MPITDKAWTLSSFIRFAIFRLWHFEFKNADAETLLTLIGASVTRAHHHTRAGFFLASEINHDVSDRRIAFDRIRSAPKEEIVWFYLLELEEIVLTTDHGLERACVTKPNVLVLGVIRYVGVVLDMIVNVVNKPVIIHTNIR